MSPAEPIDTHIEQHLGPVHQGDGQAVTDGRHADDRNGSGWMAPAIRYIL